ncbi:MAG: nucleotidyltransferase family protein, partial [Pseudanabaena sp.]
HRTNHTRGNDIMISESTTISTPSLQQIYQRLNTTPEKLARFCEKWQIIELALFGSALRDNFRPDGEDPSDIDLLYTSAPETRYGFQFFDMQEELEKLLNRKVDLVSKRGIENSRNYLRRKSILESTQVIYAKRSTVNP